MTHYFGAFAALAAPLFLFTVWTGISASPKHLGVGLFAAILAVATHSLLILFMIVTGRVLREATRVRTLEPDFLAELNAFFARRAGYPLALLSVLFVAAAAVLGYGQRAFGLSPAVHMLVGLAAVFLNLWTFGVELGVMRENQRLIDRAASALDRIDRELEARGELVALEETDAQAAERLTRIAWTIALGAWLPFLYIWLIEWRGDVSRVSVHPWVEVSLLGLGLLWLVRRARGRSDAPR
jgi:hypothetical protein